MGPLVMAIVACTEEDKQFLNKIGVKDSKQVVVGKRTKLARIIKKRCPYIIIKANPSEIDNALLLETSSLNLLEADLSSKLLNRLLNKFSINVKQLMLDLPSKNKEDYLNRVKQGLDSDSKKISLLAEFKADENYVEVSAASILAKTVRDASMKTISKKLGVDLGSGYPSDPKTKTALKEFFLQLKDNKVLRLQWKTIKNLENDLEQTNLFSFSKK